MTRRRPRWLSVMLAAATTLVLLMPALAWAYPPGVGILADHRSCTSCHAGNGPWADDANAIVDILDARTRRSLRQADGKFLVEAERGRDTTVITIIGRRAGDAAPPPLRNGWLYVDPAALGTKALSKFTPGWDVNLPMSCRLVGDPVPEYPGARVTALPMTLRPGPDARDAEIELQAMLTAGDSKKAPPNEWMTASHLLRTVRLKVTGTEPDAAGAAVPWRWIAPIAAGGVLVLVLFAWLCRRKMTSAQPSGRNLP